MAQIQLRRGTVAAWAAANPILADGEPGFALPDGPLKVGNGIDPWLSLPVSEGGLTKAEADNTYAAIGSVGGGEAYPPVVYSVVDGQRVIPELTIACFGDSLTFSSGTDWPTTILAAQTGMTVVNRGISGQGAADIILRQGGLQPRLTLATGEIPAETTPASVTVVDPSTGWRTDGSGSFGFGGTLAGIAGTLAHNLVDGSWSFTRTTAGSVVPVPAGTAFIGSATARNPIAHQIIWAGRNNAGTLPMVRDLIGLAIEKGIETQVRRYLVIGVTNGTNEGKANATYAKIAEHNRLLKARYGKFFYDIQRDFIDNGLSMAGITPTPADLSAIADDRPPASLMTDVLHPNAAGYAVVGQLIANKVLDLGWVPALTGPTPAPTTPPTVTAGVATANTLAFTLTTVSGATSYPSRYRLNGSSGAWTNGPTPTGTSATVTGLAAGTAYEVQFAAANGTGQSAWSASVVSTTGSSATVLTSDSFNRADTTAGTLGTADAANGGTTKAWTSDSQLQILSNQVGATTVSTTRNATVDVGVSDHYVEITLAATTEGGITARFTDANSYYAARGTATGQLALDARAAGATTSLDTTAAGFLTVGDRIGLWVHGTDITVYKNGVQALYKSNALVTTGTRAGLRSAFSNAAFRLENFIVKSEFAS